MKNSNYSVEELNLNDLSSISGGSWLTRAIFEELGELAAALSNALKHDQEHGLHGHI